MDAKRSLLWSFLAVAVAALALLAATASAKGGGDRNRDRIPDKWEKRFHLSLKVKQGRKDPDHDGLKNKAEFRAGTNPRDADTDEDGIEDGEENIGVVKNFDGETLTIKLFRGGLLTGDVTDETEFDCGDEYTAPSAAKVAPQQDQDDEEPTDPPSDDSECSSDALVPGVLVEGATFDDGEFEQLELATG